MAGNSKPSNIGEEASFKLLSGSGHSGQTGKGLFDGIQVNEWNTDKVFYWNSTGHYIEIEIISPIVNIWRSGTSDWSTYTKPLKISKWNGSSYIDITDSYPQTITAINHTQWEKTITNLPSGRYKLEYSAAYRMDSEWYIEEANLQKFLLSSNDEKTLFPEILYSNFSKNVIPIMTSNTTPYGVASSSSEFNWNYSAWKAFDGDIGTRWAANVSDSSWVAYEFEEKKIIGKYALQCNEQKSVDWTFDAFDESTNTWVTLHSVTGATWSSNTEKKTYIVKNKKAYQKYRINTTKTDSVGPSISTFEMMEVRSFSLTSLPSVTENDFINYGIDKGSVIDLSVEFNHKGYIERDSTLLGSGKVFKQKIDTSKIPIKKVTIE